MWLQTFATTGPIWIFRFQTKFDLDAAFDCSHECAFEGANLAVISIVNNVLPDETL